MASYNNYLRDNVDQVTPGGDREGWRETNRLLVSSGLGLKKMGSKHCDRMGRGQGLLEAEGRSTPGKDLLG